MRKLIAAFVAVLMSTFAHELKAQLLSDIEGLPPYKLGVTAGLNISSFSNSASKYTPGFELGMNLMLDGSDLIKNCFARTELKYSMKGAHYSGAKALEYGVVHYSDDISLHYIELPVHVGYAWYVNEDWSIMAETGPYFAFGLWGNVSQYDDAKGKRSTLSVFGDLDGSRFDMGWGVQASAMFLQDYQFHISYDHGFINLGCYQWLQNRNISLGFTYFFE